MDGLSFGKSVRRLSTSVSTVGSSFSFVENGQLSHHCEGDSGGPILTDPHNGEPGATLPPDALVSVTSSLLGVTAFGPVLQTPSIRSWLSDFAVDSEWCKDGVGDGVEAWQDNCDTVCNPNQQDSDEDSHEDNCQSCSNSKCPTDGGGDACDLCPHSPNHIDYDGDLIADCNEPCPGVGNKMNCPQPNNLGADLWGDADHDGICNDIDLCPCVKSYNTANCNLKSENARQQDGLPVDSLSNHCDPVPCPFVEPTATTIPGTEKKLEFCKDINAEFCPLPVGKKAWLVCERRKNTVLQMMPLASHDWLGAPKPVDNIDTTAWMCVQPFGGGQFPLGCESSFFITDDRLGDSGCVAGAQCSNPGPETLQTPFHRLAIQAGFQPASTAPLPFKYELTADEVSKGIGFQPLLWHYLSDYARWTAPATTVIQDPGSADQLVGTLWFHADTTEGSMGRPELANHHRFDFAPTEEICTACEFLEVDFVPELVSSSGNGGNGKGKDKDKDKGNGSGSASQVAVPHLIWRPVVDPPTNGFRRRNAVAHEAHFLVPTGKDLWATPTGENKNCGGQIANDALGVELRQALSDPAVRWVNAAEPLAAMGAGESFPLAVGLSAIGGSELLHTVTTNGVRLLGDGDRDACAQFPNTCDSCPSGACNDAGWCCELPCSVDGDCPSGFCNPGSGLCDVPPRVGSPHAKDYVAVLTRMRRGVFVVGGVALEDDTPTGEIWFSALGKKTWGRYGTGNYAPHLVLAATYSFVTDDLYVLDETADGDARLVAVHLGKFTTTTIGVWKRHAEWDQHWLTVDRDGALLLASSTSAKKKRHRITRIDVRGGLPPAIDGVLEGKKPLVLPPLVDAVGYTLVVKQDSGNDRANMIRLDALDLQPATLATLAEQL